MNVKNFHVQSDSRENKVFCQRRSQDPRKHLRWLTAQNTPSKIFVGVLATPLFVINLKSSDQKTQEDLDKTQEHLYQIEILTASVF